MNKNTYFFTSEAVGGSHPDSLCDLISDHILDAHLAQDPNARVACETLVKDNTVVIAGEITSKAEVDYRQVVSDALVYAGYDDPSYPVNNQSFTLIELIGQQSPDIAMGVDSSEEKEQGAGDQGLMFGYATKETREYMPLPISLAHLLVRKIDLARTSKTFPYLRPDCKTQITVEYDRETNQPLRVDTVVVSTAHSDSVRIEKLRSDIKALILGAIPSRYIDAKTKFHINPTGSFTVYGPHGDSGLTGRKIIVNTYGGACPHGGGAFCLTGDTRILTEEGYLNITEIKPGQSVITDKGVDTVMEVFDNGLQECFSLQTDCGREIKATANHPLRVMADSGEYIWKDISEIMVGDWLPKYKKPSFGLGVTTEGFEYKPGHPNYKPINIPAELTEDWAYLMGALTGDGSTTNEDAVLMYSCDSEMHDILSGLYSRLFEDDYKIYEHESYGSKTKRFHKTSVEAVKLLRFWGLKPSRAFSKEVPESIFKCKKEVVASYLQGLFDTDGCATYGSGRNEDSLKIFLATTSPQLAKDVQLLLDLFGISANIRCSNHNVGKKNIIDNREFTTNYPLYTVNINGPEDQTKFIEFINFKLQRKRLVCSLKNFEKAHSKDDFIPGQRNLFKELQKDFRQDIYDMNLHKWIQESGLSEKRATNLTRYKALQAIESLEDKVDLSDLKWLISTLYFEKVVSVESVGIQPTYDLRVESDEHTFIANGFVSHNSGKDPSKVDRSAAYMARYIAKNIVDAGLAARCEIQISYAIGVAQPTSVYVKTFGTSKLSEDQLSSLVTSLFDLTPAGIVRTLDLKSPVYKHTAPYHFGRDGFSWERLDASASLREAAEKLNSVTV